MHTCLSGPREQRQPPDSPCTASPQGRNAERLEKPPIFLLNPAAANSPASPRLSFRSQAPEVCSAPGGQWGWSCLPPLAASLAGSSVGWTRIFYRGSFNISHRITLGQELGGGKQALVWDTQFTGRGLKPQ